MRSYFDFFTSLPNDNHNYQNLRVKKSLKSTQFSNIFLKLVLLEFIKCVLFKFIHFPGSSQSTTNSLSSLFCILLACLFIYLLFLYSKSLNVTCHRFLGLLCGLPLECGHLTMDHTPEKNKMFPHSASLIAIVP